MGASPGFGEHPDQSRATRVLIVDDERMNRQLLAAGLRGGGYETAMAADGVEAWDALDRDPFGFDVILLDRRMPRMDGMELLVKVKADPRLADIPVVMQTAYASAEDVAAGVEAGVFYYLAKPLDRRLMLSVVAAAVEVRLRLNRLKGDLGRQATALTLLERGSFRFRTLAEANTLAVALAQVCPRSTMAVVGLSEIFTNAIEHGNLALSNQDKARLIAEGGWTKEIEARLDAPQFRDKMVSVEFERTEAEIRILVRDQGEGFNWRAHLDFDPARAFAAFGRGIAMARRLCFDALDYRDPGNEVVCVQRRGGEAAAPMVPPPDVAVIPAEAGRDSEDIRLARAMQSELLPQPELLARIRWSTGLAVTGFHESSSDLGGDLWGVDLLDEHRVALWLADFSGHGVTAALNVFRLHALISNLDDLRGRPGSFLGELNRRLEDVLPVGQYATMLYGILDVRARQFTYAAAAAPAPVKVALDDLGSLVGDGSGLPLGVAAGGAYGERKMAFLPGDLLFMASDALAESPDEGGTRIGGGGVVDLVRGTVAGGAINVDGVLAPFLATVRRPLHDDLTAICCLWPK